MFRRGMALCAAGLMLTGCGGSSSSGTGTAPSPGGPAAAQSATLALRVQQPAALQHLPFDTASVTVSLLDPGTLHSGTLQSFPTSVIPNGGLPVTGAFTLTADKSGQFLYVCDVVDHQLVVYSIDAGTGGLTALPSLSVALPSDAQFSFPQITPDNRFLYINTNEPDPLGPTNGTIIRVRGYQRDAQTGALSEMANSPFDPGSGVAAPHTEVFDGSAVTIDPTGHFLYELLGAQPSSGPLQVFVAELAIDQTDGSLSPLSGSPDFVPTVAGEEYSAVFLNLQGTLGITLTFNVSTTGLFDPSGQLLLLPSNASTLDIYTLSGTTVPATPTASLASAPSPGFMVFDPTEQYLLTVCRGLLGNGFTDGGINIYGYTTSPPSLSSLNNFVLVQGRSDMAVFAVPAQPVQQ